MKWIEFIRVRSSEAALQSAMPSLRSQVKEIEDSVPDAETFFLQHAIYDGDLAIVVVWRNETKPQKSREGLLVAKVLETLGPLDHSVWQPTKQEAVAKESATTIRNEKGTGHV